MRTATLISRAIAGLLAVVLVVQWRLVAMLFAPAGGTVLAVVVALFLALSAASIAGLLLLRPWGFVALYLLVPVATVLHGISLVPLLPRLLPLPWRFLAVLVLNSLVFLAGVVAHARYRQAEAPRPPKPVGTRRER